MGTNITMDRRFFVPDGSTELYPATHVIDVYDVPTSLTSRVKSSVDTGSFTPGIFRINPYSISRSSFQGGSGSLTSKVRYPSMLRETTSSGPIGAFLTPKSVFLSALTAVDYTSKEYLTLQRAMAKVGGSDFDGGVEIGELRETLAMLRRPFSSLRDFLFSKGKRNVPAHTLLALCERYKRNPTRFLSESGKSVADTWLEIRYGLRPLLNSIQSVMELVEKRANKLNGTNIRSKSATWEDQLTNIVNLPATYWRAECYIKRSLDVEAHVRIRAKVYYTEVLPRSKAVRYGLAPQFIPEIMWELTRLSFVLDWIFSIGPWLGSYRVKPGIKILGNTVSVKISNIGRAEYQLQILYPGIQELDGGISNSFYEASSYNRRVNLDLPTTPLFLQADKLGFFNLVDSLALILQPVFTRLSRR